MTPDALAELRQRLVSLRDDALRQLAEADTLDGGLLRLVGDADTALRALGAPYARFDDGGHDRSPPSPFRASCARRGG